MIIQNFLQDKYPPTNDDIIAKLMESIAEEEIALANFISSEANKINAFIGKNLDFPTSPTNQEIIDFNQTVHKIIESLLMKEWLLLRKLDTVILLKEKFDHDKQTSLNLEGENSIEENKES